MSQESAETDSIEVKAEIGPPTVYLPVALKNR